MTTWLCQTQLKFQKRIDSAALFVCVLAGWLIAISASFSFFFLKLKLHFTQEKWGVWIRIVTKFLRPDAVAYAREYAVGPTHTQKCIV